MNDNTQASVLPFPADSAEYEEYQRVMGEIADIQHDSAPDPIPSDLKDNDSYPYGEYDPYEDYNYRDDIPDKDDSHMYPPDDDQSEYGMSGCCGDF